MPDERALIVTAIDEHPRRRGRFIVSVADEPVATVSVESITELHVRVGGAVSDRMLDALRVHDRRTALLDRALRQLAMRGRATTELTRALRRGRDRPLADDVNWVVRTLTAGGYLNDERFADQFVRDRANAGWAKHRLRQELRRRGVSPSHIEPALAQADEEEAIDDTRSALAAAQKWRRTHTARDPERDRQRLYGFLARRGFSAAVIGAAMRAILDEGEGELPIA